MPHRKTWHLGRIIEVLYISIHSRLAWDLMFCLHYTAYPNTEPNQNKYNFLPILLMQPLRLGTLPEIIQLSK